MLRRLPTTAGNTAGSTSLHILIIRTGYSLGTNKVFFGCGSHDEDGHRDEDIDEGDDDASPK